MFSFYYGMSYTINRYIANVFIIFSVISFGTAIYYFDHHIPLSLERDKVVYEGKEYIKLSSINISEKQEIHNLKIVAYLKLGEWASINGQVFDQEDKYVFSFGRDVSNYSNVDKDEQQNTLSMLTTFSQPGQYYYLIGAANDFDLDKLDILVFKKSGSAVPHFILGFILLGIGIFMSEIKSRFLDTKKSNM